MGKKLSRKKLETLSIILRSFQELLFFSKKDVL